MSDDKTGLKTQIRELIQSAIKEFCAKNDCRFATATEPDICTVGREKCNLEYRNHGSQHFFVSVRCFFIQENQSITIYFIPSSSGDNRQNASRLRIDQIFEGLIEQRPGAASHTIQFLLQEALAREEAVLEKDRIKK